MSFVSVGDIQTFFLGTVRSQESSVNANGTDTLSMQISIILGGQTFVLAPSVSASTTNNNITFTSGSDYTAVQNMLVSGDLQYKIGAIVQWSNDGSNWTTNPTTATSGNGQTRYYRVSFRLLDIPAPEPSTYALMGTGLAGMLLLRRRIS